MCLLAACAKHLSGWETAQVCGSTWDKIRVCVQWVMHWGPEHCKLDGVQAIGIDEVAYRKGHKYMSVVYDIGAGSKRLLWIGQDRTKASIKQRFSLFGSERCLRILYVCSDRWRPGPCAPGRSRDARTGSARSHRVDRHRASGWLRVQDAFRRALRRGPLGAGWAGRRVGARARTVSRSQAPHRFQLVRSTQRSNAWKSCNVARRRRPPHLSCLAPRLQPGAADGFSQVSGRSPIGCLGVLRANRVTAVAPTMECRARSKPRASEPF
jgi:hypothetical protein